MAGNVKVTLKSVWDDKGVRDAQKELGNLGRGIGVAFGAATAAVIGATAVIADFASKAVTAAEEVRQADNRLGQVAESMGLFGAQTQEVTNRLIGLAEANEINLARDAETVKLAQAKLLTFKQLASSADEAGGAFDRATAAAFDLAATGFGTAEDNATQLGKALEDPVKGLSALTRSGITFTKEERAKIKTLTESGKVLEAQDMILKAIESQVGGTAAATVKSSDKMKLAFENVYETVGEALLPVFDELTVAITDLTPEISRALTPILSELAQVFRDEIVPLIKEFTGWLASPKGTQAVRDLTKAVIDSVKGFFDFTKNLMENWDQIVAVTTALVGLYGAIKVFTTVTTAARAAMLLFNVALTANPIGALIVTFGLATAAVIAFSKEMTKEELALRKTNGEVARLGEEQRKLTEKIKQGGLGVGQYKNQLIKVNDKLMEAKTGFSTSAGEANRFTNALKEATKQNNILNGASLSKYRSQLGDTRIDAEKLVNAQRELAFYMAGGKPGTYKPFVSEETGGGGGGGGGGASSVADTVAEARKQVQKIIKDAQKRVADAKASYRKAVDEADKAFVANEIRIRQDYGVKLVAVIEQSKNRIRDAFRSVAEYNVATFLQSFREVEDARLKSFEDAKKVAQELGMAFTDVFTAGDPVQAYLDNLRNKLVSNKKILDTSAKLLEAGFSQTFIEQIISTGEQGGVALAEGLLSSSPETIREIQSLFKEIEAVSTNGANALADKLYAEQGLATRELVALFANTNQELNDALAANYEDYGLALTAAGAALKDTISEISADFSEAIAELDGKVGGLTATIRQFYATLAELTNMANAAMSGGADGKTQGAGGWRYDPNDPIGNNSRLPGTRVLPPRDFPVLPNTNTSNTSSTQPGTVINVNVKTDVTQSTAQVGQVIATAISKYTGVGGKVLL